MSYLHGKKSVFAARGSPATSHFPLSTQPKAIVYVAGDSAGTIAALATLFEGLEYAAWNAFRQSENAAYVGLCMSRLLARLPYGEKGELVREFNFQEKIDGDFGENHTWMNAAYGLAINITRAVKEYGWAVQIRGIESGGTLFGVPGIFDNDIRDDCETNPLLPSDISIDLRHERKFAELGFIPFVFLRNRNRIFVVSAQSIFKPKQYYRDCDSTAASYLKARLPYIFAVSHFIHYLKVLTRDRLGIS
jgi:type VI secretion system protein ImpC